MAENVMLLSFFVLTNLAGIGLFLLFGKIRIHQKKTIPRLILANLSVLLFVCAAGVLVGEIYFRFAYDTTESFGLSKTTRRWFQRHFVLNSLGIRDSSEDYFLKRRGGASRLTFLGDSFTAGHGVADVEDRFANRIRKMMPGTEVHVFARLGTDTADHLESLREQIAAGYELDVVLLVYCLNDIADIVPEWQEIENRIRNEHAPGLIAGKSYFFNWLYIRRISATDPDVLDYFSFIRKNYDGLIWERQAKRLATLQQEVERHNGKLMVVTFPFLHSLGPDYEYKPVHKKLAGFWRHRGVEHLDLLSVFDSCLPEEVVVNRFDAHPNERAHAMAAHAIADFIQSRARQDPEGPVTSP